MSALIISCFSNVYQGRYKLLRDGNLASTMNHHWDALISKRAYLAMPEHRLCCDYGEFYKHFGQYVNIVTMDYPDTLRGQRQSLLSNNYNKRIIANFEYIHNYLPGIVKPPYTLYSHCSSQIGLVQPCDEFQEELELAAKLAEEVLIVDEGSLVFLPEAKLYRPKPVDAYYKHLRVKPTYEYKAIVPFRLGATDYHAEKALEIAANVDGKVLICGAKEFYTVDNLPANCTLKDNMTRVEFLNAFTGAELMIMPRNNPKWHYTIAEAEHFNVKLIESIEDLD